MKLKNPHQMMIGSKYKITEPFYEDFDGEYNSEPESEIIEVIKKTKNSFLFKDTKYNVKFERDIRYLMECEIEED